MGGADGRVAQSRGPLLMPLWRSWRTFSMLQPAETGFAGPSPDGAGGNPQVFWQK
jgi:hypothetical protein